jgi:quercetin dioxygenase-like cupin family protein
VRAKDLRVVEPEPLDCSLDGYAWIPRMLDKARATMAGTEGSYMFGCPVDHTCMARLGVRPELVLELAAAHDDDHAVLAALRDHGVPTAEEAWFDGPAVEDELQLEDVYLRVRPASGTFTGAEHGAAVSVEIVEAEPGFAQELHTHPTEEVVVAVDGAATYYLGDWQARIVRAGQVVRIPADVAHRFTTRGRYRAVAAFGAPEIVAVAAPVTA